MHSLAVVLLYEECFALFVPHHTRLCTHVLPCCACVQSFCMVSAQVQYTPCMPLLADVEQQLILEPRLESALTAIHVGHRRCLQHQQLRHMGSLHSGVVC